SREASGMLPEGEATSDGGPDVTRFDLHVLRSGGADVPTGGHPTACDARPRAAVAAERPPEAGWHLRRRQRGPDHVEARTEARGKHERSEGERDQREQTPTMATHWGRQLSSKNRRAYIALVGLHLFRICTTFPAFTKDPSATRRVSGEARGRGTRDRH